MNSTNEPAAITAPESLDASSAADLIETGAYSTTHQVPQGWDMVDTSVETDREWGARLNREAYERALFHRAFSE